MHLAFNIFIRFCTLGTPYDCTTYLAYSDFHKGDTLEICQQAAEELALEKLITTDLGDKKFLSKTWCAFNIEQNS